jgi:hypothetical protein
VFSATTAWLSRPPPNFFLSPRIYGMRGSELMGKWLLMLFASSSCSGDWNSMKPSRCTAIRDQAFSFVHEHQSCGEQPGDASSMGCTAYFFTDPHREAAWGCFAAVNTSAGNELDVLQHEWEQLNCGFLPCPTPFQALVAECSEGLCSVPGVVGIDPLHR